MKFWKAWMPNLCISLWLALLTLVILDQFNPMLGFLKGKAFLVLVTLCAFSSLSCAALLYRDARKKAKRRLQKAAQARAASRAQARGEATTEFVPDFDGAPFLEPPRGSASTALPGGRTSPRH